MTKATAKRATKELENIRLRIYNVRMSIGDIDTRDEEIFIALGKVDKALDNVISMLWMNNSPDES